MKNKLFISKKFKVRIVLVCQLTRAGSATIIWQSIHAPVTESETLLRTGAPNCAIFRDGDKDDGEIAIMKILRLYRNE